MSLLSVLVLCSRKNSKIKVFSLLLFGLGFFSSILWAYLLVTIPLKLKKMCKRNEFVFSSVKTGNFSNASPYEIQGSTASSVVCFFFLSFKITCHLSKINMKGKYISGYVITHISVVACL